MWARERYQWSENRVVGTPQDSNVWQSGGTWTLTVEPPGQVPAQSPPTTSQTHRPQKIAAYILMMFCNYRCPVSAAGDSAGRRLYRRRDGESEGGSGAFGADLQDGVLGELADEPESVAVTGAGRRRGVVIGS